MIPKALDTPLIGETSPASNPHVTGNVVLLVAKHLQQKNFNMALMTEERRKEMEEEMNRFELEIAAPSDVKTSIEDINLLNSKPLSPPPGPPTVSVLIPEVLTAPPPPPPPLSPPMLNVLHPPPPPPMLQRPPLGTSSVRFIPHQLQRTPSRPPPMRQNFMPMRGPPMNGPPGPFHPSGHFAPPMNQGPPMGGPHMSGPPLPPPGPIHHMHPGQMPMGHMSHMPPQMGVSLPVPPGFGPPSANSVGGGMNMGCDAQQYMQNCMPPNFEAPVAPTDASNEESSIVAAAPAIYAAPFVKSEGSSELVLSANGQETLKSTEITSSNYKMEKQTLKNEDTPVGPTAPPVVEETVVTKKKEKKKKTVRMAGGQAWEDSSLLEWENDDFRIFCGDLGNDVTDEVLIRAFSKYGSFVKAKVIRDKRTNKTKGYGFVSFKDPQDFIKAMREMNGRYVGSRPIKLRKSTWRDRNIDIVKKKQREKEKLGLL